MNNTYQESVEHARSTIAGLPLRMRLTVHLRTLPDFFIIGCPRGGTTTLHKYLSEHPYIRSGIAKEPWFFCHLWPCGVDWYKTHFPTLPGLYLGTWLHNQKYLWSVKRQLTFEASSNYLAHPRAAERIHSLLPQAKLLILLRNPVDRAYSHYWLRRNIREDYDRLFQDAVEAEMRLTEQEFNQLMANDEQTFLFYRELGFLEHGKYMKHINRYLEYFPRSQMLILNSEQFYRAPQEILNQVTDFLDVPRHMIRPAKLNDTLYGQPMPSAIRLDLKEYFHFYNEALYKFLGEDFSWN